MMKVFLRDHVSPLLATGSASDEGGGSDQMSSVFQNLWSTNPWDILQGILYQVRHVPISVTTTKDSNINRDAV